MSVVVGYAPTDEGRAAVARAVAEARMRGSDLVVVDTGREASLRAEDLQPLLGSCGVPHALAPRGAGDAAEDVIAAAADAQLVVIGLRRRTAVGKLILGSGATRILLEAPCAVLTVKPDPA